ncbi:hypothetical protein [Nostoc sp. UHCC 0251]|uniref:hypothetical protein n=1 Tax=Nostoc sp. UHCC 0251 TaxID=3110240 RepID=UPI002B208C7B|nr:hypothetical protein [Nostoc sp. UHCC 0251]MEA5622215.1 hypothetical protein [Nostoc sp. UHCC 0251]
MTQQEKDIYVGAVIELNGNRVNLIPSTPINQIKKQGLKLALDKPIELGKFGDAINSICKDLGIEEKPTDTLAKIDTPLLKTVLDKVADADMRIEALQYEQPPTEDKVGQKIPEAQQAPTKYVFVASVNWKNDNTGDGKGKKDEKNEKNDFFKLKGLIFGISSGFTKSETGENPEVQKAFLSALQAMTPVAALPAATKDSNPEKPPVPEP